MNERIRELAEQAGGYVSLSYEHEGKLILSGEDVVQKFAELIVRECAKNAVLFADSTTAQGLPSKYIENYMLKHFGVE